MNTTRILTLLAFVLPLAASGANALPAAAPEPTVGRTLEAQAEPIPWSYTASVLVLAEDGAPEWFGPIRGCVAGRDRGEALERARTHASYQISPYRRVLAIEVLVITSLPR